MGSRKWEPWEMFCHYVVARCVFSDWAGAGYKFARGRFGIMRFWTRRGAQRYADKLNAEGGA